MLTNSFNLSNYLSKPIKNNYYVYGLFQKSNNMLDNCFYIGKGLNNRINRHFHSNSTMRERINFSLDECYGRRIFEGLSETKAIELEQKLIKSIGINNLVNRFKRGGEVSQEYDNMINRGLVSVQDV